MRRRLVLIAFALTNVLALLGPLPGFAWPGSARSRLRPLDLPRQRLPRPTRRRANSSGSWMI
jgi:hypothetical protein